jgi:hypothetical protein
MFRNFIQFGCLFIVSVFFIFWNDISRNIPISDDFPAFVDFIIRYNSVGVSLQDFISQINEHRLLYDRLWLYFFLIIAGTVNFKILSLIGNLSLVVLFIFLSRRAAKESLNPLISLIFSSLIFSPLHFDNAFCAMMSLQNFTFPLLILIGLYLLIEKQSHIYLFLSYLLISLAFYTTAIGFVAFLIGGLVLLYQKRKADLIIWLTISAAIVTLYFASYISPPLQGNPIEAFMHPHILFFRFFAFLGAAIPISVLSPIPEFILGIGIFSIAVISLFRMRRELHLYWVSAFIFFLIIAAAVSIGRFQLNEFISTRFKINSVCFISISLILYLKSYGSNGLFPRIILYGSSIFFLASTAFSYRAFSDYKYWVDSYAADLMNIQNGLPSTIFLPKKTDYLRPRFTSKYFLDSYKPQSAYLHPSKQPVLKKFDLNYIENSEHWKVMNPAQFENLKDPFAVFIMNDSKFYSPVRVKGFDKTPFSVTINPSTSINKNYMDMHIYFFDLVKH